MKSIVELVASHPFAAGLNDEHVELVAACARNISLETGEMLCVEGASADTFYLLRRGHVSIEVHQAGLGADRDRDRRTGRRRSAGAGSCLRTDGRLTLARCSQSAPSLSTARACAQSLSMIRRSASPSCLG